MKPSELAKSYGLKSLQELSDNSGTSVQTLNNWCKRYEEKEKALKAISLGALCVSLNLNAEEIKKAAALIQSLKNQ